MVSNLTLGSSKSFKMLNKSLTWDAKTTQESIKHMDKSDYLITNPTDLSTIQCNTKHTSKLKHHSPTSSDLNRRPPQEPARHTRHQAENRSKPHPDPHPPINTEKDQMARLAHLACGRCPCRRCGTARTWS